MSLRSTLIALLLGIIGAYAAPMTWPEVAGAESCPNEEVRAEQGSGRLPDCRAFELVTPEVKGDDSTIAYSYGFPDGNHVYYTSLLPLPGALNGGAEDVLGSRTASGWVNTALAPPAVNGEPAGIQNELPNTGNWSVQATFTGDFSAVFVDSTFGVDPLDQAGAPAAYRFDPSTHAWSLAALPDTGPMTKSLNAENPGRVGTYIAGASQDGAHVFFQTFDQLPVAPGTPGDPQTEPHTGDMLYDRTGGHTYAVGVLPNKTVPQCQVFVGDGATDATAQGSLNYGAISPDGTNVVFTTGCGGVYLRVNDATTVQLAGVTYVGRSSDGSKVLTAGEGGGLYEYDTVSGTTTTITTDEGLFVASSADGSHVYYEVGRGQPEPGLYLWDKGTRTLILGAGEGFASEPFRGFGSFVRGLRDFAVATPDGSKLLFLDTANLTSYNSLGNSEVYVYDATAGSFTCVSCNPTGAPPLGGANTYQNTADTLLPSYSEGEISPDGSRVFFETPDALVSQDTNGRSDVYEWENGRIYLISSGQGTNGSHFVGASSDGTDVLVFTTDRLAPQDIESSQQIYDARVGGGFPYRPFIPGCDSGQCQGPQTPAPSFGPPASATFVGLGNPAPAASAPAAKAKAKKCKKGFVRKKNKCVRKKTSKTARRASGDRGAKSHA
jgi:Tol biopolymer transport system component